MQMCLFVRSQQQPLQDARVVVVTITRTHRDPYLGTPAAMPWLPRQHAAMHKAASGLAHSQWCHCQLPGGCPALSAMAFHFVQGTHPKALQHMVWCEFLWSPEVFILRWLPYNFSLWRASSLMDFRHSCQRASAGPLESTMAPKSIHLRVVEGNHRAEWGNERTISGCHGGGTSPLEDPWEGQGDWNALGRHATMPHASAACRQLHR